MRTSTLLPLALALALLLGAGSGFAASPWVQTAVADASLRLTDAAAPVEAPTADGQAAEAPDSLSAELVYDALVAEVALQRGDFETAVIHFLRAARLALDPGLAERAVRTALTSGQSAPAREALDYWIGLEPESAKAHQLSAFLALEAEDRALALASLRRVIALAETPGQGYRQAAQLLGRLEKAEDRLAVMRELVDLGDAGDDPDAIFALATLAAAAGDQQAATDLARQAAALRPSWTGPQLFLVRLLVRGERADEAQAMLDQFIEQSPDDRDLKLLKAQLLMDGDQPEQALRVFQEMLEQSPERVDVLFAAAALALDVEQPDTARDYLERLQALGERPNDVAFLLGQAEELAGHTEAALAAYEQVEGQNRTSAQVRIANLHAEAGDMSRAREVLQQMRDQYPDQASTLSLIEGELLREQGFDQQAFDVYSRALDDDPDNMDLLYARAMTAVGMDKVALLERDLRRVLTLDPDHVDALNALGYTLADRTDRYDAARAFIERALELRPDDPAILDSMGWVLYRQGQSDQAEGYLRRALDQVFDAEIAAHLGEVLWSLGRRDEAREVWTRALEEDPDHKYLLRVLSRFRFSRSDN